MALTNSNTINTRIQLKYDTYENWLASTLEILPGEMCVALVNLGQNENTGTTLSEGSGANAQQIGYKPTILIKIGDGIKITDTTTGEQRYKYFNELDYVQTKAGDVYSWAKDAIPPDATELYMDNENANRVTIAQQIASITTAVSGANTNTVFRIAYNAGTRQIRLEKQDGTNPSAAWEVVALPTAEQYAQTTNPNNVDGWINLGASTALDDSVVIEGNTIGAQISAKNDNALTVKSTAGEKGLYTPITKFTSNNASSTQGSTTVDVISDISANIGDINSFNLNKVNLYTKEGIDALLNPSMEFMGLKETATLDGMTLSGDMVGNSYKLSTNGSSSLLTEVLRTARIGDLAIVCKEETTDPMTDEPTFNYYWDIIPSGDESVVDTYRPIAVDGQEKLGGNISTGYLNFKSGTGITLRTVNQDENGDSLTINDINATEIWVSTDPNVVASKTELDNLKTHTGYNGGLGTYDNNGTQTNHTVKTYIDQKVAAIDVANLIQDSTYLIFNCGNASGWTS